MGKRQAIDNFNREMKSRRTTRYNGYANRDTWLVCLWINNDRKNYQWTKSLKSKLLKMKKDTFLNVLRGRLIVKDKVYWENVRVTEVKQCIREN